MSILIAYDGKPETEKVLDYAIKTAVAFNEPLYILTVVPKDLTGPEGMDPKIQEYMEAAQLKACEMGADAHSITYAGKPEDVVLEVANNFQCDAIVVGRPFRSRLDRMVMGSVSQSVIQDARCVVILVPDPEEEE